MCEKSRGYAVVEVRKYVRYGVQLAGMETACDCIDGLDAKLQYLYIGQDRLTSRVILRSCDSFIVL